MLTCQNSYRISHIMSNSYFSRSYTTRVWKQGSRGYGVVCDCVVNEKTPKQSLENTWYSNLINSSAPSNQKKKYLNLTKYKAKWPTKRGSLLGADYGQLVDFDISAIKKKTNSTSVVWHSQVHWQNKRNLACSKANLLGQVESVAGVDKFIRITSKSTLPKFMHTWYRYDPRVIPKSTPTSSLSTSKQSLYTNYAKINQRQVYFLRN